MNDKRFLKHQRRAHLTITGVWFIIVGGVAVLILPSPLRLSEIGAVFAFGLFPPLISTILNWNDTSRYC